MEVLEPIIQKEGAALVPLARYVYRSRSFDASKQFMKNYLWDPTVYWAPRAFQKVGVTEAVANETTSYAKIVAMKNNASSAIIDLQPPAFASTVYGGPRMIRLVLHRQLGQGEILAEDPQHQDGGVACPPPPRYSGVEYTRP